MEEWKKAVKRSKIPRLPWKKILGKTLTEFIIEQKSLGRTKEEISQILWQILKTKEDILRRFGFTLEKAFENAKISIGARFAESEKEFEILVRKGWYYFKAKVRKFPSGDKFIYFPLNDYKPGDIVIVKVKRGK